jgi:endonuclease YncB( thermonuclease family)
MAKGEIQTADGTERAGPAYHRDWRSAWWLMAAVALVGARIGWSLMGERGPEALAEGDHEVARVVDGETLSLANGARVRLAGVNVAAAPTLPGADTTKQLSAGFVARSGRHVGLTFRLKRLDGAGQFLAFVWSGVTLLNEELIRSGAAKATLSNVDSSTMKRRLAIAEREARREERGIWSTYAAGPLAANRTDEVASHMHDEPYGTDEGASRTHEEGARP